MTGITKLSYDLSTCRGLEGVHRGPTKLGVGRQFLLGLRHGFKKGWKNLGTTQDTITWIAEAIQDDHIYRAVKG